MKISLSRDRAVDILTATGPIEPRDAQVLKAGVSKLIRDGKNQIAIEISEARVPTEMIRELVALDLLAREMSGRVIVVSPQKPLRVEIESFARPTTLESFESRAQALEFFEKINAAPLAPLPITPTAPTPAAAPALPGAPPVDQKPAEEEVKLLKEQIRERELKEVGELRKTIARLEDENKALLAQLQTLVMDRRAPPDEAAYRDRVRDLEDKLEKLMEEMGQEKPK